MYVSNFFNRFINTKVTHKEAVIEIGIYESVKNNFQLFWLMYFFSLNIAFSCMGALLYSFEIWSSNDNRLSIVIPKRVTKFSDSISLLSIWSFSWITFFVWFCGTINWSLSGFTIMLLFLNQFTADSDSFFNVSSNVSLFLDATEIVAVTMQLWNSWLKFTSSWLNPSINSLDKKGSFFWNRFFLALQI